MTRVIISSLFRRHFFDSEFHNQVSLTYFSALPNPKTQKSQWLRNERHHQHRFFCARIWIDFHRSASIQSVVFFCRWGRKFCRVFVSAPVIPQITDFARLNTLWVAFYYRHCFNRKPSPISPFLYQGILLCGCVSFFSGSFPLPFCRQAIVQ